MKEINMILRVPDNVYEWYMRLDKGKTALAEQTAATIEEWYEAVRVLRELEKKQEVQK